MARTVMNNRLQRPRHLLQTTPDAESLRVDESGAKKKHPQSGGDTIVVLTKKGVKLSSSQPTQARFESTEIKKCSWEESSTRHKAYNTILEAEAYAQGLVDAANAIKRGGNRSAAVARATEELIAARVAGFLFVEFEAQAALFEITPGETLIRWVLSDPQDPKDNPHDVVIWNGQNLRDNFIRPFRTPSVHYPPTSSHSSRPSFHDMRDMMEESMKPTGKNYTSSRNRALARDGFRCVVTGVYDERSLRKCPQLGDGRGILSDSIEVAHIFNESATQNIEPGTTEEGSRVYNKTYHSASAMNILRSFGFSKFADAFTQTGGVHQVWNLIALSQVIHRYFDDLNMWFVPTDTPHRYRVCTHHSRHGEYIRRNFVGQDREVEGAPDFVEFNAQNKDAPPPDCLLLALHGLCARVAHMSGAAEFFDRLEWDAEATRTLAFDGSSCALLDHLLLPFSVRVSVRG